MRHVNNATYLTYCEIARLRYWTDVTGEGFSAGNDGAESLILAEARITYRDQTHYGETVIVQSRATRIGTLVVHPPAPADGGCPGRTRCDSSRSANRCWCGSTTPPSGRSRSRQT